MLTENSVRSAAKRAAAFCFAAVMALGAAGCSDSDSSGADSSADVSSAGAGGNSAAGGDESESLPNAFTPTADTGKILEEYFKDTAVCAALEFADVTDGYSPSGTLNGFRHPEGFIGGEIFDADGDGSKDAVTFSFVGCDDGSYDIRADLYKAADGSISAADSVQLNELFMKGDFENIIADGHDTVLVSSVKDGNVYFAALTHRKVINYGDGGGDTFCNVFTVKDGRFTPVFRLDIKTYNDRFLFKSDLLPPSLEGKLTKGDTYGLEEFKDGNAVSKDEYLIYFDSDNERGGYSGFSSKEDVFDRLLEDFGLSIEFLANRFSARDGAEVKMLLGSYSFFCSGYHMDTSRPDADRFKVWNTDFSAGADGWKTAYSSMIETHVCDFVRMRYINDDDVPDFMTEFFSSDGFTSDIYVYENGSVTKTSIENCRYSDVDKDRSGTIIYSANTDEGIAFNTAALSGGKLETLNSAEVYNKSTFAFYLNGSEVDGNELMQSMDGHFNYLPVTFSSFAALTERYDLDGVCYMRDFDVPAMLDAFTAGDLAADRLVQGGLTTTVRSGPTAAASSATAAQLAHMTAGEIRELLGGNYTQENNDVTSPLLPGITIRFYAFTPEPTPFETVEADTISYEIIAEGPAMISEGLSVNSTYDELFAGLDSIIGINAEDGTAEVIVEGMRATAYFDTSWDISVLKDRAYATANSLVSGLGHGVYCTKLVINEMLPGDFMIRQIVTEDVKLLSTVSADAAEICVIPKGSEVYLLSTEDLISMQGGFKYVNAYYPEEGLRKRGFIHSDSVRSEEEMLKDADRHADFAKSAYKSIGFKMMQESDFTFMEEDARKVIIGELDCTSDTPPSHEYARAIYDAMREEFSDPGILCFIPYEGKPVMVVQWKSSRDSDVIGESGVYSASGESSEEFHSHIKWGTIYGVFNGPTGEAFA